MARNHVPQFAESPAYTGLRSPTRARKIVTALTELPEGFIQYVDDNVAASKGKGSCTRRRKIADVLRSTTGFSHKSHNPTWSRLLDKDGGDPDRASEWNSIRLLPKGLLPLLLLIGSLLKGRYYQGDAHRRWRRQSTRRIRLYDSHLPSHL
jgi:hypothetical protein